MNQKKVEIKRIFFILLTQIKYFNILLRIIILIIIIKLYLMNL